MKHPLQKIYQDERGIVRFRANAIIRWLLDTGRIDLNEIARYAQESPEITEEDESQFNQLLGFSIGAFFDLSCSGCDYKRVVAAEKRFYKKQERS